MGKPTGFLGCEGYVADTFGVECNERTYSSSVTSR